MTVPQPFPARRRRTVAATPPSHPNRRHAAMNARRQGHVKVPQPRWPSRPEVRLRRPTWWDRHQPGSLPRCDGRSLGSDRSLRHGPARELFGAAACSAEQDPSPPPMECLAGRHGGHRTDRFSRNRSPVAIAPPAGAPCFTRPVSRPCSVQPRQLQADALNELTDGAGEPPPAPASAAPSRPAAARPSSGAVAQPRLRAFQISSLGQRRAHSFVAASANAVAPSGGRSSSSSITSKSFARSRRIQSP